MMLRSGQAVDPMSDILGQILNFLNYINIFVIPAFTMKVMTEELSHGTHRLLDSAPLHPWSIVCGKFLGVMFYFGVLGLLLLVYPSYSFIFSEPDVRVLASGWLGMMLNTATIVSIGLFIASLTKNPVLSYLGSTFFIILFLFSGFIPGAPEWYKHSANILDMSGEFTKGIIKTGTIATFIAIILIFLFLTRFVVESRKWRV